MRQVMTAVLVTVMLAGAAQAQARPPLRDVAEIDDGLLMVGIADLIRKNCPDISARIFRALGVMRDLEARAKAMGYTDAEIDAHVESDVEKDRLRARGARYFAARGVAQDQRGYCALGRQEIARNSAIGVLLRARN